MNKIKGTQTFEANMSPMKTPQLLSPVITMPDGSQRFENWMRVKNNKGDWGSWYKPALTL